MGPTFKFTDEGLRVAWDILAAPRSKLYTGMRLRERLLDDHVLPPPVDVKKFLHHLEQYCRNQGHALCTRATVNNLLGYSCISISTRYVVP